MPALVTGIGVKSMNLEMLYKTSQDFLMMNFQDYTPCYFLTEKYMDGVTVVGSTRLYVII